MVDEATHALTTSELRSQNVFFFHNSTALYGIDVTFRRKKLTKTLLIMARNDRKNITIIYCKISFSSVQIFGCFSCKLSTLIYPESPVSGLRLSAELTDLELVKLM